MDRRTLILHPRYDEDSNALWEVAVRRGWASQRVGWRTGKGALAEAPSAPAIYGGWEWGQVVAASLGVALLSPTDALMVDLPAKWKLREVWLSTIAALRNDAPWKVPVFVKSLRGKSITSRIYHSAADLPDVGDGTEVIVQQPVEWADEYRFFVTWKGIATGCRYATAGKLDVAPIGALDEETDGAVDLVNRLLAQHIFCGSVDRWPS